MKSLSEQQKDLETEIKQLENRQKILLNRKHKEERRERTHRLIENGAILESIFPEVAAMTDEQVKAFLQEKR